MFNVFHDTKSIPAGARFDLVFMRALCNTVVCCPYVTPDAVKRMQDPANLTRIDHVLLEWSLALYLNETRQLECIYPILAGEVWLLGSSTYVTNSFSVISVTCCSSVSL